MDLKRVSQVFCLFLIDLHFQNLFSLSYIVLFLYIVFSKYFSISSKSTYFRSFKYYSLISWNNCFFSCLFFLLIHFLIWLIILAVIQLSVRIFSMRNTCDLLQVTVSYLHLLGLYGFKCTGLMFMLIYLFEVLFRSLNLDPSLCSDYQVCLFSSVGPGEQAASLQLSQIRWAVISSPITMLVARINSGHSVPAAHPHEAAG